MCQFADKQDTANSAFIILIIQSQNQWSGLSGRRAGEDGLVWCGICEKDSQDDFDSECIGYVWSPDD